MTAISIGDEVAVRDVRQLGARRTPELPPAELSLFLPRRPWFVIEIRGVAALIGLSPITPVGIAAVTPLSNLRRKASQ